MTVAILIDTDILIDASRRVDLAVDFIAVQWLSTSMRTVSHADVGAEVPLETPIGWAKA